MIDFDKMHDEDFKPRFLDSEKYRWLAMMIAATEQNHHEVHLPAADLATTFEQRARSSDAGDLFVGKRKIAVKSLTRDFHDRDDYPYPEYMIDNVTTIDALGPDEIWRFNASGTHCAVVDSFDSGKRWYIRNNVNMASRGYSVAAYFCPWGFVHFRQVDPGLHRAWLALVANRGAMIAWQALEEREKGRPVRPVR